MFAASLVHVSIAVLPVFGLPEATRECRLEVLTPFALEERTLAGFQANVQAYVRLHRHFVRALPGTHLSDEEGWLPGGELRAALVAARPLARQGGFFTPAVAEVFKARIDGALLLDAAVHPGTRLHDPLTGEPRLTVNEPFPIVFGAAVWPAVAHALPPLPTELQYAFWGRDLALVDVAANLVIDVLPGALPYRAHPGTLYQ